VADTARRLTCINARVGRQRQDEDKGGVWTTPLAEEHRMSQPISDTFAQQLRQMRSEVLAQLRTQRGGRIGRAEAAAEAREHESDDWAQADAERDLKTALEERESAELVAIDEALKRVADGSYGLCVDCGVDIGTARLHASPTAMRCVACQEKREKAQGGSHTATY
jgi:DnaK suppressor protein